MNFKANRTKILSITAILLLTTSMIMITLPTVTAANRTATEYAFVSAQPNPAGVGQKMTINAWQEPTPPPASSGLPQNRFHDYKVTITDSSGAVVATLTSTISDPLGSWAWQWTPSAVGTYTATFTYPGETFGTPYNVTTLSSTATYQFTVNENPTPSYPMIGLSGYWTRPVAADIQGAWDITGNWMQSGYNATGNEENMWSSYPQSPHIMWVASQKFGGISGGAGGQLLGDGYGFGGVSYHVGEAYESEMSNPLILLGRLYVPVPVDNIGNAGGTSCYDLRTGELLWTNPTLQYSMAQLFDYESINQGGTHAYLWWMGMQSGASNTATNVYIMYDAFSGQQICNFSSPQTTNGNLFGRDNHGSILAYMVTPAKGWVAMWNSTKALDENGLITYQSSLVKELQGIYGGQLRPVAGKNTTATPGGSWNWTKGLEYNNTAPSQKVTDSNSWMNVIECDGIALMRSSTSPINNHQSWVAYRESDGAYLWNYSYDIPAASPYAAGCGLLMQGDVSAAKWLAIDVTTGKIKWTTPSIDLPWGIYGPQWKFANGIGFASSYAGKVHAFDVTDGHELWSWAPNITYANESPSGSWFGSFGASADGIITFRTIMSWPHGVLENGHAMYALNTTTGQVLWHLDGWYQSNALADGYLVAMNIYTNQITCIGLGPSATTVQASPGAIVQGNSIMITGTVTDQSPGSPIKGTAAVSDASMSDWMAHKIFQKPVPSNVQGVPVSIDAIDPNGNYVHLGDTTSDMSGVFNFVFTPTIPGKFVITATFFGSGGYAASSAETAAYVQQATASTSTPAPVVTQAPLDMYLLGATIAIIIAIAVAVLILRKRP